MRRTTYYWHAFANTPAAVKLALFAGAFALTGLPILHAMTIGIGPTDH